MMMLYFLVLDYSTRVWHIRSPHLRVLANALIGQNISHYTTAVRLLHPKVQIIEV